MNCKAILTTAAAGAVLSAFSAVPAPEVSVSGMSQGSQGVATISYVLSAADAVVTLDIETNATGNVWASIGGAAVSLASGDVWKKVGIGSHTIKWDGASCWTDHKIPSRGIRAVVTAWALDNTPDYMAVDISSAAQPDTQTYYPSADFVPGGVSSSLYKTTKLLMRKIMAKDVKWTMGSTTLETQRTADREATHQVTLTNNYYIGVYEITQSQWSQVATNSTASAYFTTDRSMRPMERVCYNEIRLKANSNAAATSDEITNFSWPKPPCSASFLGLLRSKTGIDFDLPSDAQWEFAARAGNGDTKWGNGSAVLNSNPDTNLNLLCRYGRNGGKVNKNGTYSDPAADCGAENGTAIVGSYAPNAWGLYDMHGNVWEWCLDWYQADIATAKDTFNELYGGRVNINPSTPANCLSGTTPPTGNRVIRGGHWSATPANCRPAARDTNTPTGRNNTGGFRVLCTAGMR